MAERAEQARSFGSVADEYDRGRPGYPAEAIHWVLGSEPLDVVDLGAGTGKLTEALVAAGHRVIAVEPLPEMSAHLRAKLPDLTVLTASAEETGLPDASCDAVLAGAAFHWFDRSRAFPEVARILREPGILGLLGNGFDRSVDWVERFATITGSQRYGQAGHWPDAEELGEWFAVVEDAEFRHGHPLDRGRLLDLTVSRSQVATLEPGARRALLDQVGGLWDSEPALGGAHAAEMPYVTRARRSVGRRWGHGGREPPLPLSPQVGFGP